MNKSSNRAFVTLSILLASSLLVSSFTATPARAVDYTKVGVKVGDWANYSFDTNFTGIHQEMFMNLTIHEVDKNRVEAIWVARFPNGTSGPPVWVWGNVSSGEGGPSTAIPLLWFVLVPNLTQGDLVFPGRSIRVNDTGTMVAAGVVRTYVHANITVDTSLQDFRMDQATGIGIQGYILIWTGFGYEYFRWILNSTSLWSPQPPLPLALVLAIGGSITAVVVVAAVVVWLRRRKK